ncbi:MAG TPA: hypothetical protein VMT20_26035 [Terriglobia bacterium]|nr:hypothetical protein [Terriglobia bacterium]
MSSATPTSNQILTWNGTSWAPAAPPATGAQIAQDLGGSTASPKVVGLQGNPVSTAAPTSNQVLTWNGTTWSPATPAAGAGTGTCGSNQFVTGVVLGSSPTCTQPAFSSLSGAATAAQLPAASASAQGAVQLAQDLTGSASAPKVAGLQGNPVSANAPGANQFLGWSGTQWTPAQPNFSNLTGAATSSQLPAATSSAQGAVELTKDLTGSATVPKVAGLQGNPVSSATPTSNQVLTWNGTTWTPTTPAATAGTGACPSNQFVTSVVAGSSPSCTQPAFSSLSGAATAAQLPAASSSAQGAVQLAQDLTGSASAPRVAGLQGNPVSSVQPSVNQVLTFNGTTWIGLTPTSGAGTGNCSGGAFVTGINLGTSPSCNQPAFSNLSGALAANQATGAVGSPGQVVSQGSGSSLAWNWQVGNPVGNIYYVDGKQWTSLNALIATLPAKSQVTVYDNICGDTFTSDPFNQVSGLSLTLILDRCSVPYKTNVNLIPGDRSHLTGITLGKVSNSGVEGTSIQAGSAFANAVINDTSFVSTVPTFGTSVAGSCTNTGPLYVRVTLSNAAQIPETRANTEASTTATSGNCVVVNPPAAVTNAAYYNVYAATASGNELFEGTAPMGTSFTFPGDVNTSTNPPPGQNSTGAMVIMGNTFGGSKLNQQAVTVENVALDCRGIAQVGIFNAVAEELSGIYHDDVGNCGGTAAIIEEGRNGGFGANNSDFWDNTVQASNVSTCGSGSSACNPQYCVLLDQVASFRELKGLTCVPNNGITTVGVEVQGFTNSPSGAPAQGASLTIRDIHVEGMTGAMTYGVEAIHAPGLVVDHIFSSYSPTVVHLDSTSSNATLSGILVAGSGCALKDDFDNLSCSTTPGFITGKSIGFFASGVTSGAYLTNAFGLPDASLASAYSGTGACGSNSFVTALSRGAAPSCAPAVTPQTAQANQFATGITASGALTLAQPGFSNLSGSLALNQTPLTANGDLLTVSAGTLSRLPIGSANQCLQVNSAATAYQFGPCASGAGTAGGSTTQVQFNNNGSLSGAASLTYNSSTGGVTAGNSMFIGGPAPWVDVTAAGAKCDGSTDDTVALQAVLAGFNTAGYGRMFIPNTGTLCIVKGYTSAISGSIAPSTPSAGYATITVSTPPPSWVTAGAPLDIWGTTGGTGGAGTMGYNGVFLVSSTTSTTIVISSSVTGTSSGGNVSVGLWSNAIIDIEGQCTTRQNSANCSGFSTPAADSPVYIFSSVPCTTAISGSCPSGQNSNTVSIRHLNFKAGSSTTGIALGGIYTLGVNGFEISDNNFQNFTGAAGNGLGAGAGITYDGGPSGYTENGYTVNNKFYNTKYGITLRNKASGNLIMINHMICTNASSAIISNSIAVDMGYTWATAGNTASGGGENTLFANQEEGCMIGYIFDYQNNDNIISKSEITASMTNTANSIGFSVLNSFDMWLDIQTKNYATGVHINGATTGVHFTNPRLLGANSTQTITSDGGSFTSASNYVEPGALPTTAVFGLTDTQTSNSTFQNDTTTALTLGANGSATPTVDGTLAYDSKLLINVQGSNSNTFHTPKFQSVSVSAGSSNTYDCLASVTGVTSCGTQASSETAFATSYTIPANEIVSGKTLRLRVNYQTVEATAGTTVTLKLRVSSTSGTTICGFPASTNLAGTRSGFVEVYLTGMQTAQASASVNMNCNGIINGAAVSNATATPITLATNAPIQVVPTASFAAATATNQIELTGITAEYF